MNWDTSSRIVCLCFSSGEIDQNSGSLVRFLKISYEVVWSTKSGKHLPVWAGPAEAARTQSVQGWQFSWDRLEWGKWSGWGQAAGTKVIPSFLEQKEKHLLESRFSTLLDSWACSVNNTIYLNAPKILRFEDAGQTIWVWSCLIFLKKFFEQKTQRSTEKFCFTARQERWKTQTLKDIFHKK